MLLTGFWGYTVIVNRMDGHLNAKVRNRRTVLFSGFQKQICMCQRISSSAVL